MIYTLSITVVVEGSVALGYSIWCKKPIFSILITSILANLITQSLVWVALRMFFRYYVITLITVEILIWLAESAFMYWFPGNRLKLSQAIFLSFCMNLASLGMGWFLPV